MLLSNHVDLIGISERQIRDRRPLGPYCADGVAVQSQGQRGLGPAIYDAVIYVALASMTAVQWAQRRAAKGISLRHSGDYSAIRCRVLQLNRGEYTVKVVPVSGGEGKEEHVKLEAHKVTVIRVAK